MLIPRSSQSIARISSREQTVEHINICNFWLEHVPKWWLFKEMTGKKLSDYVPCFCKVFNS